MPTPMMTTSNLRSLLPALLAIPLSAQTPAAASAAQQNGVPNQAALALRVTNAHQPDGKIAPVNAFTSKIELELKDVTAEQGGQATLDVRYLELKKPSGKKPAVLLRYEVNGAEERIVRGFDVYGPWHLRKGKPADLTAPNAAQDYKHFKEHRNLARQLVQFLTPGNVISQLKNCGPVTEREIVLTRRKKTKALAIDGELDRFPMMHNGGEESPAKLTVWVDTKTSRLLAVDVVPIVAGKQRPELRERIKLQKLHNRNGLLVPKYLHYLVPNPKSRDKDELKIHSTVHLVNLDLRPNLTTGDFNRK